MHQVRLGNPAAVSVTRDDDDNLVRTALEDDGSERITEIDIPDDATLSEAFASITAAGGVWEFHSDGDPTWVSSTHKGLAELLADHFGCETRKHDTKVVTVHGDSSVAKPAAHRKQLAAHVQRLGAGDAVEQADNDTDGSA